MNRSTFKAKARLGLTTANELLDRCRHYKCTAVAAARRAVSDSGHFKQQRLMNADQDELRNVVQQCRALLIQCTRHEVAKTAAETCLTACDMSFIGVSTGRLSHVGGSGAEFCGSVRHPLKLPVPS